MTKTLSDQIIPNFGIKDTYIQDKKRPFLRYNTHSYFAPDLTPITELQRQKHSFL